MSNYTLTDALSSLYGREELLRSIYVDNIIDQHIKDELGRTNTRIYLNQNILDANEFAKELNHRLSICETYLMRGQDIMLAEGFDEDKIKSINIYNLESIYTLEMPVDYPAATALYTLHTARQKKILTLAEYRKEIKRVSEEIETKTYAKNEWAFYPGDLAVSLVLLSSLKKEDPKLKINKQIQNILDSEIFKFSKNKISYNKMFKAEQLKTLPAQLCVHVWVLARAMAKTPSEVKELNSILPTFSLPKHADIKQIVVCSMLGSWFDNIEFETFDSEWIKSNVSQDELGNLKNIYNANLKKKVATVVQLGNLADNLDEASLLVNKYVGTPRIFETIKYLNSANPGTKLSFDKIPYAIYDLETLKKAYTGLSSVFPLTAELVAARLLRADKKYTDLQNLTASSWMTMLGTKVNNVQDVAFDISNIDYSNDKTNTSIF